MSRSGRGRFKLSVDVVGGDAVFAVGGRSTNCAVDSPRLDRSLSSAALAVVATAAVLTSPLLTSASKRARDEADNDTDVACHAVFARGAPTITGDGCVYGDDRKGDGDGDGDGSIAIDGHGDGDSDEEVDDNRRVRPSSSLPFRLRSSARCIDAICRSEHCAASAADDSL